jgi:hypothetical protein
MKLAGTVNENEFYTEHYVLAILENDLRDLFVRWAGLDEPPYAALKKLSGAYDDMKRELARTSGHAARLDCRREWFARFFAALGYTLAPRTRELEGGILIPVAGEIANRSGKPELWILETLEPDGEPADPLALPFQPEQVTGEVSDAGRLPAADLETVLTKYVFAADEPPRWVILFNTGYVLDRHKWTQKRMLRFDLAAILGREEIERKAAAALLHHDSVTPAEGACLLDTLGENSHKQAFAVSQDLKYSAREAVELLANEVVYHQQEMHRNYTEIDPDDLTHQCLRYLYRLLFLFYVEARPELGYAPIKSDEYRTGYSLETLRDVVELGDLTTDESRNGYFLHDSISLLFRLVWEGFPKEKAGQLQLEATSDVHTFRLKSLQGDLFNPAATPLLNGAKVFRNVVLQRVLELLSLSRPANGRSRGRISYRELGINQLGAVSEGLLSYTGFFVTDRDGLYEVKKAGEQADPLQQAYFVRAADLPQYRDDEKVYDDQRRPKWYPQGTFIYRLAGRNRQKSASYYTPKVLTECVVKYALKELLKDKTADQILDLTICEPALGSGAFLNEALDQLAAAYLERKRKERHRDIEHGEIERETQKVKAWLADNIANLFKPETVDKCYEHDGKKATPGIKDENGDWETSPHRLRILHVDEGALSLFARLYDDAGTAPLQARLPALHTRELVDVLRKLNADSIRFADVLDQAFTTPSTCWNETASVHAGVIKRETRFPLTAAEWILSGPHFSVATPFAKTPRADCASNLDYDPIDLEYIGPEYMPRTNYVPACDAAEYAARIARVPWGSDEPVTNSYRLICRSLVGPGSTRTLVPAICPRGAAHVHTVLSVVLQSHAMLLRAAAAFTALSSDFYIKTTGQNHIYESVLKNLPLPQLNHALSVRILALNCISAGYSELWRDCSEPAFTSEEWSKFDVRLRNDRFHTLTPEWQWSTPLRTDYERRQAQVEIDVLVALELGLTLEQLCTIYRIQFYILHQNEQDTWYDRSGRIVFTSSKAVPGVGFARPEWERIREMKSGTVPREIDDNTLPGGPRKRIITYEAPFDRCDRIKDYEEAWEKFEKRREAAKGAEA